MPDIPDDFARTGLHVVAPEGAAVTRFQVLGERSSGTNFVKRLLGRNTALRPTEALGWKHGFPSALAIPADLAVICVVRHAADWALSMHARPWHATPALQALPFPDFLRARWETVIDRPRYFDGIEGVTGRPLQQDRDPLTGEPFADLFALRRAKLTGLLSYLGRDCTCVLLRHETAAADPEGLVDAIHERLGLPAQDAPFRPVLRRLGSKFKPAIEPRPATPERLSEDDLAHLRARLDLTLEARLGYLY